MAKVCLECATPKFMGKVEKGLHLCIPCNRDTHTIDAQARRPLCHDCKNFGIKCTDGVWRPALNYGRQYLGQASCTHGEGGIRDAIGDMLGPKFAKYEYSCGAFKRHGQAPYDKSPNPLSPEERKEWRDYLEMPKAFWLEPRRWEGVIDTHKQMFWDKGEQKTGGGKAVAALAAVAVIAGIFAKKKSSTSDT